MKGNPDRYRLAQDVTARTRQAIALARLREVAPDTADIVAGWDRMWRPSDAGAR